MEKADATDFSLNEESSTKSFLEGAEATGFDSRLLASRDSSSLKRLLKRQPEPRQLEM